MLGGSRSGTVFAILYLPNLTRARVGELATLLGEIRKALGSAEGVLLLLEALDQGRQRPQATSSDLSLGEKTATAPRLTFQYPNSAVPVLEEVMVSLPRARVTFVVGGSGAGKSTPFKAPAGLYLPDFGYGLRQ